MILVQWSTSISSQGIVYFTFTCFDYGSLTRYGSFGGSKWHAPSYPNIQGRLENHTNNIYKCQTVLTVPQLADFGLAMYVDRNPNNVIPHPTWAANENERIRGTEGYFSPVGIAALKRSWRLVVLYEIRS